MSQKTLNTRIINKHATEADWIKAVNFIPKQAELIVYDIDETHNIERFKIGDGINNVNDLPFANNSTIQGIAVGNGDNSLIFNDIDSNTAYGKNSAAMGLNNIVGSKAYEVQSLDISNITACLNGTTDILHGTLSSINGLETGMNCSCHISGEYVLPSNNLLLSFIYELFGISELSEDNTINVNYESFGTIENIDGNNVSFKINPSLLKDIPSDTMDKITDIQVDGTNDTITLYIKTLFTSTPITINGNILIYIPDNIELGDDINSIGNGAFASGISNISSNEGTASFGYNNIASGKYSFVTGDGNKVYGESSVGFGHETLTNGKHSLNTGYENICKSNEALVSGNNNTVTGHYSFTAGYNNKNYSSRSFVAGYQCEAGTEGVSDTTEADPWNGVGAIALGWGAKCFHGCSQAIGTGVETGSKEQFVVGRYNEATSGIFVLGNGSSSERKNALVIDSGSNMKLAGNLECEGSLNFKGSSIKHNGEKIIQTGSNPATIYTGIIDSGRPDDSLVWGADAFSTGSSRAYHENAIAMGSQSVAYGFNSIALGYKNTAGKSDDLTVESKWSCPSIGSVAIGWGNTATHGFAQAIGSGLNTSANNQVVLGKYNANNNKAILIVGNGTNNDDRKNAFVVNTDGSAEIQKVGNADNSVVTKKYVDDNIGVEYEHGTFDLSISYKADYPENNYDSSTKTFIGEYIKINNLIKIHVFTDCLDGAFAEGYPIISLSLQRISGLPFYIMKTMGDFKMIIEYIDGKRKCYDLMGSGTTLVNASTDSNIVIANAVKIIIEGTYLDNGY